MKVGITGAYGFVGSHLRDALISTPGIEVEVFDREKYDLFNIESLKSFVKDKEVVYHLANVNRDTKEHLIRVNILGTLNLMEALTAYAPPDVRIIYLSSFQVYQFPCAPEALSERSLTQPQSIYGISKKAAEEIIVCYPLRSIIFRGSNFFGPRCKPYYNSVISTFCDLLVQDKPFTVHGSGEQGRDFLYIGDVVELLMQTLHYRPQGVEVVNLCSGKMVTVNSIIKLLSEISGKQVAVDYQNASAENVVSWWGDNTACREKFNWMPRVPLKEGLTLTYQWFKKGGR